MTLLFFFFIWRTCSNTTKHNNEKKGICSGTKWKKNTCFPNNGIKPDPDKIAKVVILLCPTNPDEIRQFNWIQSKFYQRLNKDRRTFKQDDETHLKLKEKPGEFISITQETIPGFPITRKHLYFIHKFLC